MPGPPPKPPKGPDDLAEVERALSVLQGRHPEHERARREDEEARKRRAAALDSASQTEVRRVRLRWIVSVAVVVPVVALFAVIAVFGKRELERRARIDAVSATFRPHGFTPLETSLRGSTGALETTAEPGCLLAVSTEDKPVSITRGGSTVTSAAPALFCTCASERIAVTSPVGGAGGIALLRADAALIGGSRAFAYAPFKASTNVLDDACGEASLDAWIDAKHYPQPATSDAWLSALPARAGLAAAGFHVAAIGEADKPFVVVEVPKESCVLASGGPLARLSLRLKGEPLPGRGVSAAVARCAQAEATVLVAREGGGELVVLVAPASKVGGAIGLREIVTTAGLTFAGMAMPSADHAWNAKQLLVASAVPDAIVTTATAPDVAPDPPARIAALSLGAPGALHAETAADVLSSCTPPLDPTTREALCVFSGAQRWRSPAGPDDGPIGGLARSKLPSWLFTMQGAKDQAALDGIVQLLALARTLGREGFAPTTLDALIERQNGVEVLGRTGEDAVVAVGVGPSEPWVYTLSDDAPWTLGAAPQIALVKPLEKVTLTTALKRLPPIGTRRTIVFRRQAH